MNKAFLPAALVLLAAALSGCLLDDKYIAPPSPGEAPISTPYKIEGNTIFLEASAITDTHCDGDALEEDTRSFEADTVEFKVTGSALTIYAGKNTLGSGAVVQWVMSYTRVGSGTGLKGLWSVADQKQHLVSGTLSESDGHFLEDVDKYLTRASAYTRYLLHFGDGMLISYEEREYAKQFVSDWNDEFDIMPNVDSTSHAITAKALDRHTVELKGRKSGETVRLTINSGGTTYSSDRPGHDLHRYFFHPVSCPNILAPMWYVVFLEDNMKAMALDAAPGLGFLRPGLPLKKSSPFYPLETSNRF